jgi:hypothetical protein
MKLPHPFMVSCRKTKSFFTRDELGKIGYDIPKWLWDFVSLGYLSYDSQVIDDYLKELVERNTPSEEHEYHVNKIKEVKEKFENIYIEAEDRQEIVAVYKVGKNFEIAEFQGGFDQSRRIKE